jgi:hypothetical protein
MTRVMPSIRAGIGLYLLWWLVSALGYDLGLAKCIVMLWRLSRECRRYLSEARLAAEIA